jgi:hypothetical protein
MEKRLEDTMRNRLVTTLVLTALIPISISMGAEAQQNSAQQHSARLGSMPSQTMGQAIGQSMPLTPKQPVAEVFTHAKLGFTVIAPPGASLKNTDDGHQLAIRSIKGFAINIQAGPARPDIPLKRMSALLETRYLGAGKPWDMRGTERSLTVSGLPAYEVKYGGSSSQARVVVARGQINDYVFIFMAPHHQFIKLGHEFDWVLQQFKSGAREIASKGNAPVSRQALAKQPQHKPIPVQPAARKVSSQHFSEPGFGYAIDYPSDWEFNKPAKMTTMFSGREGTPAYAAIIGVQNIQPSGAANGDESVNRALNQLKSSLGNAVRDLKVLQDSTWAYQRDGRRLLGRQVTVSYTHAEQRFRKQLIVIPRPSGNVAHVWSYTAPERQFASFQPIATRMLSSWRILSAEAR